jgi:hypothetical protein
LPDDDPDVAMHARSIVGVGGAFTGALSGELAQETPGAAPPATMASSVATLFQNVRIFDGTSAALSAPSHVTLGVVKEGALADLLLVEGNLLENIQLIEDPDQNFPDTSATVEIEDQMAVATIPREQLDSATDCCDNKGRLPTHGGNSN